MQVQYLMSTISLDDVHLHEHLSTRICHIRLCMLYLRIHNPSDYMRKEKSILMMGGVARGRWALQDVWCSVNCISWSCSTSNAPWSARSGHAAVALGNTVLLVGGVGRSGLSGDVWKCKDGIGAHWTCESDAGEWPARYGHCLLDVDEALFLLTGVGLGRFLNDVWRSDDQGVTWRCVTLAAPFAARAAAAAVAVKGCIVLAGGRGEDGCFSDLWISEDGAIWSELTSVDAPKAHSGASLISLSGTLLLLGGFDGEDHDNTMWEGHMQNNTVTWTKSAAPWLPRYCHQVVMVDPGVLLLTGGHGARGDFKDAWTSPSFTMLRSLAMKLSLLGRAVSKRYGVSKEVWENSILPHLIPSVAMKLIALPERIDTKIR